MTPENPLASPDEFAAERVGDDPPRITLPAVRVLAVALGVLLLGYMFLGRGFAHIGLPPLYIGEVVLAIGIVATGYAFWRNGVRVAPSRIVWLLLGLMALGAIRTIPYIGQYGFDALRDATLWGYGIVALMVFVLADRDLVVRAFRLYGWVVPVFALWLPISYNAFAFLSGNVDPNVQGISVPLIFFKGGDMAVHMVGAIAFLVLGATAVRSPRSMLMSVIVGVPIMWTALVAGAANRGALLTVVVGVAVVAVLAPRSRNWLPLLLATVVLAGGLTMQGAILEAGPTAPTATASSVPTASASPTPFASRESGPSPAGSPSETASGRPTSTPSARPTTTAATGPSTSEPSGRSVRVANADFELGTPSRAIDDWTPFGVGTYLTVGEGGHGGTQFAEVNNTGHAYQARLTSSRFPFDASEDIQVSLWAKAVRGSPTVEIYVNWYDRSGQRISSVFIGVLATGGARVWQEGVGVYPAPSGTTDAEVLLWEAAGNATVGIDDVTVRQGDFVIEPPVVRLPKARPATIGQLIENILSVFESSSDEGLEGTKQFRLAWWGTIVDYTVFGDYFWTGKGFGINLADADGFQSTADHSLRAPHNSHFTVLARTGVPGFGLWLLLQAAFGIGLLQATRTLRRVGDLKLAAVGGWLLAYWIAMMVDTSFDPYLEGPQGGIWFWTVVGLGLVIMRLTARRQPA